MRKGLDLYKETALFKIGNDSLAAILTGHSAVFAAQLIDGCIVVHDVDYFKLVAQTDLEVVRVVSRCDLNDAGTEVHFNIFIGNNGNLSSDKGESNRLSDIGSVSFVLGMNGNGGIAKEGFRSCCGKLKISAAIGKRITQMPEIAFFFLELNLGIGYGGLAMGTPVDYALASVDKALFVHAVENLDNGLAAALVHCETLALPVAGGAHLAKLLGDLSAVGFAPLPCALKEAVTSEVVLCDALFLHLFDYLCFGCDGSMVGAGQPECAVALHSSPADDGILKSVVKCMAGMKLTGDVGRRHNYCIRLLIGVGHGVEITGILPHFINFVFDLFGVILFCHFLLHIVFNLSLALFVFTVFLYPFFIEGMNRIPYLIGGGRKRSIVILEVVNDNGRRFFARAGGRFR